MNEYCKCTSHVRVNQLHIQHLQANETTYLFVALGYEHIFFFNHSYKKFSIHKTLVFEKCLFPVKIPEFLCTFTYKEIH